MVTSALLPSSIFESATLSGYVPEFTGAASHKKAGLFAGVVAGAVVFAI